jgi:hypothetical protein
MSQPRKLTGKREEKDRRKFLACCKEAREESAKHPARWYMVYRVIGRRYLPVYRYDWWFYQDLSPKTWKGGWKGEVVAIYHDGFTND